MTGTFSKLLKHSVLILNGTKIMALLCEVDFPICQRKLLFTDWAICATLNFVPFVLILYFTIQPLLAFADGSALVQPKTIHIPMRDGKALAADIYLPRKEGKYPTVLIMTPYNRIHMRNWFARKERYLYDPEHYAYVIVDWRGFFGSKDAKVGLRRSAMGQLGNDGFDTVEWIANQKWSDGKVGMWGPSALGRVQYQTAAKQPPHLLCAVPVVAKFGQSYGQYYHGGVLKKDYLDSLVKVGFSPLKTFIYAHPRKDFFWMFVEHASKPSLIEIPMLLIGGWYDLFTDGVLETFQDIRAQGGLKTKTYSKIIIGPWHHTAMGHLRVGELEFPNAQDVPGKEAKRFLDYWLRSVKDNGWDKEPAVRYFQMGVNRWEKAATWPPRKTTQGIWYLHAGGKLKHEKPISDDQKDTFRYNPYDPSPTVGGMNLSLLELSAATPVRRAILKRLSLRAGPMDQRAEVESRTDLLTYTTNVLKNNVAILGNVQAKLYISSNRVDTDVAVRLCDVYPDGRSILVTDGIRRMKFRESEEKLMEPGKVYPITVTLAITAITFLKGHRIRVIITSSNYPRFDRNPNNGNDRMTDGKPLAATNHVHRGIEYPSALILPVVNEE